MSEFVLLKTSNDLLNHEVNDLHKRILEMEEYETTNSWKLVQTDSEKSTLQEFQDKRNEYHLSVQSYKSKLSMIRFTKVHIAEMEKCLKIKKLNQNANTFTKQIDQFNQKCNKIKHETEVEYESGLSNVWNCLFGIYKHLKAASDLDFSLLLEEYRVNDLNQRETLVNNSLSEDNKLTKMEEKCQKKMTQLSVKCKNYEIPEAQSDLNLEYEGILKKENSIMIENEHLRLEITHIKKEIQNLNKNNLKIVAEYEAMKHLHETELKELSNDVQIKDREIIALKAQLDAEKCRANDLQASVEDMQNTINQIRSQVICNRQKCETQELKVCELKEVIEKKDKELDSRKNKIQKLQSDLLKVQNEVNQARFLADADKVKLKKLEVEAASLKNNSQQLSKNLQVKIDVERKNKETMKAKNTEIESYSNDIKQLKERLESKRSELNRKDREVQDLKDKMIELQEKYDLQENSFKSILDVMENVKLDLEQKNNDVLMANKRADEAEQHLMEAQAEVMSIREAFIHSEEIRKKAAAQVNQLQDDVKNSKSWFSVMESKKA